MLRRMIKRAHREFREHLAYRRTRNELSALTDRDLKDLAIERSNIETIARKAAKSRLKTMKY